MRTRLAVAVLLVAYFAFSLALAGIPAQAQTSNTAYSDLSENTWYYEHVVALEAMGIFEGTDCEEGFCPDDPLERWQMAVWLVRIIDGKDPAPINESRFTDVGNYSEWMHFIDRLAELEITTGCWRDPPRYCPGQPVLRQQMASFLTRAFKLPEAGTIGFTDVDPNNTHFKDINSLAASGITTGCWRDPLRYCPSDSVTKAQMATFIGRTLNWQKKQAGEEITSPEPTPTNPEPNLNNPNNIPGYDPDVFYTEDNPLSRFVKEKIIDVYGEDQLWLREVWNYTNQPDFEYDYREGERAAEGWPGWAGFQNGAAVKRREPLALYRPVGTYIGVSEYYVRERGSNVAIHELLHIYNGTAGIQKHPLAFVAGMLYFDAIFESCGLTYGLGSEPDELYANTAERVISYNSDALTDGLSHTSDYWERCGDLPNEPTEEAIRVARSALNGEIPEWFDRNFRLADGTIDHVSLWRTIVTSYGRYPEIIVYALKDSFGGYCSETAVRQAIEPARGRSETELGKIRFRWRNGPWREGGCEEDDNPVPLPDPPLLLNPLNPNRNKNPDYDPDLFETEDNKLSRFIKEQIIDVYGEDQLWLREVWDYTNQPGFEYDDRAIRENQGRSKVGTRHLSANTRYIGFEPSGETLDRSVGTSILIAQDLLRESGSALAIHELAHIYIFTNGIQKTPETVAAAWLYFSAIGEEQRSCSSRKLFTTTAERIISYRSNDIEFSNWFWQICAHLPDKPTEEAIEVVRSAFNGEMPEWFDRTFRLADDTIDYALLWLAILAIDDFVVRDIVGYSFKDAFGGYCSETAVEQALENETGLYNRGLYNRSSAGSEAQLAQIRNPWQNGPWRDGGCDEE